VKSGRQNSTNAQVFGKGRLGNVATEENLHSKKYPVESDYHLSGKKLLQEINLTTNDLGNKHSSRRNLEQLIKNPESFQNNQRSKI
jgi:hypothetical protein